MMAQCIAALLLITLPIVLVGEDDTKDTIMVDRKLQNKIVIDVNATPEEVNKASSDLIKSAYGLNTSWYTRGQADLYIQGDDTTLHIPNVFNTTISYSRDTLRFSELRGFLDTDPHKQNWENVRDRVANIIGYLEEQGMDYQIQSKYKKDLSSFRADRTNSNYLSTMFLGAWESDDIRIHISITMTFPLEKDLFRSQIILQRKRS